jgi:carbamoyltransferase
MKILGITGLERAVPFKRAAFPGHDERDYRFAQGMDAPAALLVDGKLIAATEEERFSGRKHTCEFPINAIRYCLAEAGISIGEIDEIARGFNYVPCRDFYLRDEASAALYHQVFSAMH